RAACLVGPQNALARSTALERVPEAAPVSFVELAADPLADDGPGRRADHRAHDRMLGRDAGAEVAADGAADDCRDLFPIAAPGNDAEIPLVPDPRVAHVVRIVLLSPAVSRRVRRRIRERRCRPRGHQYERDDASGFRGNWHGVRPSSVCGYDPHRLHGRTANSVAGALSEP